MAKTAGSAPVRCATVPLTPSTTWYDTNLPYMALDTPHCRYDTPDVSGRRQPPPHIMWPTLVCAIRYMTGALLGNVCLQEYKCEHERCGYVTYSEHMLQQHQRRHSTEKPFTCEICKKSMKTAQWVFTCLEQKHNFIRKVGIMGWHHMLLIVLSFSIDPKSPENKHSRKLDKSK